MQFRFIKLGLVLISPFGIKAQTTCHQPIESEFKTVVLTDINSGLEEQGIYGPVQMAIAPDGRVFIAKMKTGEIRVYTPTAINPAPVTVVGTIPTFASTEDGLLGIALDQNFATNNWLYAFYSDPCGKNCDNRALELARFTIKNNTLANKKIIMRTPRAKDDDHHAGGGIAVDANGILIIGIGDNTDPHDGVNAGYGALNSARFAADAQATSGNSNDLRGKIIRIKPIPFADDQVPQSGIGTTYEIPVGNLWEKIDNKSFNPNWNPLDNIALVRKEIFSMGHRNPYHVRVDSKTGWIFWGEIGPDAGTESATRGPTGHDEWNLATEPGFFGSPYCNGYNSPYNMITATNPLTFGAKYDCGKVVNNSPNNSGIHNLPPAKPPLVAYASGNSTDDDPRFNPGTDWSKIVHSGESAIGGPMYRYNPALNSTIKFPPYFEGKVLFFDWMRRNFRWITLNPNGTIPAGNAGVENFAPAGLPTGAYIDMQYGPDGAMYLLKWGDAGYSVGKGPQLIRVEYIGTQDMGCYKPFTATVGPTTFTLKPTLERKVAPGIANGLFQLPSGYRTLLLYELSGRQVWRFHREEGSNAAMIQLPFELNNKLLQAKVLP